MACWLEVDMTCVKIRNSYYNFIVYCRETTLSSPTNVGKGTLKYMCKRCEKMRNIYELVGEREAILATLLGELEFHLLISSSSYD